MPTDCISYQNSGYFTALVNDYLDQKPELQSLYHRFPSLPNFEKQIHEKQAQFNDANRNVLVSTLQLQYEKVSATTLTRQNIQALAKSSTFTVTTGHQLNLFTGPLYFLYKIITTINLSKELKATYPHYDFVPIYWMATEDHDFEEINFFNFKGKKLRWHKETAGPVGRLSTEDLAPFYEIFEKELGPSSHAETLKKYFKKAYLEHTNLTDATRYLANELFGDSGLVILDADSPELKKIAAPYFKEELSSHTCYHKVTETNETLKHYGIQVNPREINLFYIDEQLRERIILEKGIYKINNTHLEFTPEALFTLLAESPEKFSPNVLLRPLYQEIILPNLCYIGGGGEIAYWMELKSFFETQKVPFPILLLRNSVLLATEKQAQKADKLGLRWSDLFKNQTQLMNEKVALLSEFPIDLSIQKTHLQNQFHYLHTLATQTDPSFLGAVKAQEIKQINGLANLELRLLKAQKRKHADQLLRITQLQNELFPHQALQERQGNFAEFYIENGPAFIKKLFLELKPLESEFNVVVL